MIEKVILACLLFDSNTHDYINKLTIDDFSGEENRTVFKIIKDLYEKGITPDYVTVANKMRISEISIKILPTLDLQCSTGNIADYFRELKQETAKRQLQNLIYDTKLSLVDGNEIDDIIQNVVNTLSNIDLDDESKRLIDVGTIDTETFSNREKIKSEFSNLDKIIGGFCLGELSVWTGKSGQGKSTFLSQLMLNTINEGYKVCAYSGELINEQFQYWLMLQACGSDHLDKVYDKIKQCEEKIPNKNAVAKIREWLKGKMYLYNNEFTGKDNNIIDVFKMAYKKYGCKVFLVDNLMTAKYDYSSKDNYYVQQSGFVGELVRFAKTYNVHVHLVAHPKKTQGELTKEDIAGTMDITNRADNTFSVNRDEEAKVTTVRILKNRSEGIQNVQVAFNFDIATKRFSPTESDMFKYKKYKWENENYEN